VTESLSDKWGITSTAEQRNRAYGGGKKTWAGPHMTNFVYFMYRFVTARFRFHPSDWGDLGHIVPIQQR